MRPYTYYPTRSFYGLYNDYAAVTETAYYGYLDHVNYDFVLAPAAAEAEERYASDYVIYNQATSDCLASSLAGTEVILPGCPEGSVDIRRQRANELDTAADYDVTQEGPKTPQQAESPSSSYADTAYYNWRADYQKLRQAKASAPFYAQYYHDYAEQEHWYPALAPYDDIYEYAANSPRSEPGYNAYESIIPYLGERLSDDHPWFDAVQQVCIPISVSVC